MTKHPWNQHGVARRCDVASAIGTQTLRNALRDKIYVQPWRGVLILAERALDPVARASAAILAVGDGAVLTRTTATSLHGCAVTSEPDVHLTLPYSRWAKSRSGLLVHHDHFDDADVVAVAGLPVLSLPAAMTELLCTAPRWKALAALDECFGRLSTDEAWALQNDISRRLGTRDNRHGVPTALSLLQLGDGRSESPQESRLRLQVIESGFPVPVLQHPILASDGRVLYRLDLSWPKLRIGLEYDGYESHEGREAYDAERDARMSGRSWAMVHVRNYDLTHPARYQGELRRHFARRGILLPSARPRLPA